MKLHYTVRGDAPTFQRTLMDGGTSQRVCRMCYHTDGVHVYWCPRVRGRTEDLGENSERGLD